MGRALSVGMIVVALIAAMQVTAPPVALAGQVEWDDQVAPVARRVEKIRGLDFERSVPVRFLSEQRFDERFAPDASELGFAARSALQQRLTAMVALQLLPAGFDVEQLFSALSSSGLAGLYDGKQIWLRGTELDPVTEFVLAHELAHALQHQNFQLLRAADELESEALAALREGEANWVATQYLDRLPADRGGTARRLLDGRFSLDPSLDGVPEILGLSALAPYSYGEELATAVVAREGTEGLDALWKKPPRDDAGVLDLLRDPNAERPLIEFDDARTTGDPWRIGALGLYYVLSAGVNNVRALDAASRWEANATQSFRDGARECVASAFLADDGGMPTLEAALGEWARYSGGRFSRQGKYLSIERCTDDVAIIPPTDWARRVARKLAQLRNNIVLAGIAEDMNDDMIRCITRAFLGNGVELINQLRPPEPTDVFPPSTQTLYLALNEARNNAREACGVELDGDRWSSGELGDLD